MLAKILPVNSRDDNINESEVSTLANAAKISHMVNETTIGAISRQQSKDDPIEMTTTATKMNNVQRQQSGDPWKRGEWRSIDLETEERRSSGNKSINILDCRAIQIKMALKSADRMRQKQVRLEMAQRQNKLNELEDMMQNLKINLAEKSATKLQKNVLLKEEQIVQVVQQIETNSQIAEEQARREMEEHSKNMAEKFNRLKRVEEVRGYFQSIKSMKDLFIMLFEKFVKTCISNQQHLKNSEKYTEAREGFLQRYESLIKLVNSGQVTSAEVDTLERICDDIKEMQRSVDGEIAAEEELIADKKKKLQQQQQEQHNRQQQQQQEQHNRQQQQQRSRPVDTIDTPNITAASTESNEFVSRERLSHYQMTMKFYEEYSESVKPFCKDDEMKSFRFDCKKCLKILSNSISSKDLQGKYDRFALILSGNSVEIGGTRVTPSQHPLGIRFVNLEVAKMFVKQSDIEFDVNVAAAFPIASLIVSLWQKFPDFGKLFLASLYKKSPFLVPYHLPKADGQSVQDYMISIGFESESDEQDKFLKRLSGLIRLYASVVISKTRRSINKPHPHGIEYAWVWLTNELNLSPLPNVSATILHEFIIIAGSELWKTYDKQFVKVLNLIQNQYMKKLNEIDIEKGGPEKRLEGLINNIFRERKIDPPKAILPANFW